MVYGPRTRGGGGEMEDVGGGGQTRWHAREPR